MSIAQRPGGEPVDIDQLTASNINDDQLDRIRAELTHYRTHAEAPSETPRLAENESPQRPAGS
ncbi:hypothetical protein [Streptomyces sp. NPDC001828]|uniref:hypothetical protein n=1 Tax=Streptomyces sp. NPDC001828 TaxID=3364615 RepID=UPI0036AFAE62